MAITFFGVGANPADNGNGSGSPRSVTPPASMTTGDLVLLIGHDRSNAATITVSTTGGQTWTTLNNHYYSTQQATVQTFWCIYNGTWAADPALSFSGADTRSAYMLVFRPTSGSYTWALENETASGTGGTNTTTGITRAGYTRTNASAVSIALAGAKSLRALTSLTGTGWSQSGISTQYRNTNLSDHTLFAAYSIGTGATNNVSWDFTGGASDGYTTALITFYESLASTEPAPASTTKLQDGYAATITGTNFGASKGTNGRVIISPSDDPNAVGAQTQTIVDAGDWSDTSITIDAVELGSIQPGDPVYLFVRRDSGSEENASGFAATVADMALRADYTLKDTDTGVTIVNESVEVIVIGGTSGSRTIDHQAAASYSIATGVLDITDPTVANIDIENDTYQVAVIGAGGRASLQPATVVDRNE